MVVAMVAESGGESGLMPHLGFEVAMKELGELRVLMWPGAARRRQQNCGHQSTHQIQKCSKHLRNPEKTGKHRLGRFYAGSQRLRDVKPLGEFAFTIRVTINRDNRSPNHEDGPAGGAG